jgi:predicted nucleic acid-binding Zn ribbon protein
MKRKSLKNPVLAGTALKKALERHGLKEAVSRHSIVSLWPKIVAEGIARHAKAEKIVGSTLYVAVDSSGWMNELAAVKHVLLQKVNSHLERGIAPITDIRFSQRSWAKAPEPVPPAEDPPPPDERETRIRDRMLEPIQDDELKRTLERILEKDRKLKYRRGEHASGDLHTVDHQKE